MWRRLLDVLFRRRPSEDSERSIKSNELDRLERDVHETTRRVNAITVESRMGSYLRARHPR